MQAAVLMLLFCCMFCSCAFRCGDATRAMLSLSFLTSMQITKRHHHFPHQPSHRASPPLNLATSPSEAPLDRHMKPKHAIPLPAPSVLIPAEAPSPNFQPSAPGPKHHVIRHHHQKGRYAHSRSRDGPDSAPSPKHHLIGHHHQKRRHAHSPSTDGPDCTNLFCSDPLTTTPIGSPCGCVLPLKVELDLGVAPFLVFTVVPELEVEVAAGTYVKQSQVRIMSAVASGPEKTRVDIDLLPLGDKFDNMTAFLIYERFWQKKVPINATVFGDYDVIYIQYPGLPSSPPSLPRAVPPGAHQLPFTAYVPPGKTQKMNPRTIAIITLSSFVLLLLCIAIVWILSKWRKVGKPSTFEYPRFTSSTVKQSGMRSMISNSLGCSTSLSLISMIPTCPSSVKTFTFVELDKATEKFNSKKILGEGGFGCVYHGILEDGIEVAVKLLTREDQNGDREFIAEIEMLSRLHHRNLVKLIGICIEGYTRCLVYELVRNGSVESHLHGADKKRGSLNWDARMKIALGAARGLAYLHEDSNPRVIHRDFKASNVLLEEDFTPKVSDFGLAREASDGSHQISTRVMGTFGYVAPEYAMTGHLLVKSDVYSYGVVLLELLSGREPVDMAQPHGQENLVTWARPLLTSREGLDLLVDPSLDGNHDFDNVARVAAIASMCVHPEVSQRPFMGEVVQALKLIYNDTNESCEDTCSQREESSAPDGDFRGDTGTGSSWWNAGTPRLTFGYASSFITMEYSSGPWDEMDRPHSTSSLVGRTESLTTLNRSGPLRTMRHKSLTLARLRGSMSEHELLSRRFAIDRYWV